MKAIKLQSGNKLHHYWLSQYIKAIVLHQREFEFEFWPIRKFHFIQPGPVPSTILNYCPIRWLLFHLPSWILVQSQAELPSWIIVQSEDCFPSAILDFWPIRDKLPPPTPPFRGIELSLLHYFCTFAELNYSYSNHTDQSCRHIRFKVTINQNKCLY